MASTRAAKRYAKAFLGLASEKGQKAEISKDIELIHNTLEGSRDLRGVLKSPVIKPEDKLKSLEAIFSEVSDITKNLFRVLVENGRVNMLETVVTQYTVLSDEINNITEAKVTTATELTSAVETKLLEKVKELTSSKAYLTKKVDPEILGGFILRVGDVQYDASISGELSRLQTRFRTNTYS